MSSGTGSLWARVRTALSTRFFSLPEVVAYGVAFLAVVGGAHLLLRAADAALGGTLKFAATWPISVFSFHFYWGPGWLYALTVVGTLLLFLVLTAVVVRADRGLAPVLLAGLVLVLATTLLQSYRGGFVNPVAGGYLTDYGGIQYYHDAVRVADPVRFVANYNELQSGLALHSRTHPPGAVLTFWALHELFGAPGLVAVAVAAVATLVTGASVFGLLAPSVEADVARFATYLFLLLPATQVYFAASLDALIAASLVTALFAFTRVEGAAGTALAAACLFLASFQTFLFVIVLPVLVGYEALEARTLRRSALVLGAVAAGYAVLFLALGFDYVEAFLTAARIENEGGSLLVRPLDYLVTRLEGITEMLVFFGPYLLVLAYRGLPDLVRDADLARLFGLGVLALLGTFAVGLFKTGETARALLYFYPFFLLPVVAHLRRVESGFRDRYALAALVFGQTFAMQLVGFYFW